MGHTSTTITAPVNTTDVGVVLGVSSNDVGYLCSNLHGKINKWAKHKPVRKNGFATTSVTYRATSGNCGLKHPAFYSNKQDFLDAVISGDANAAWEYEPPTGGISSPFRLTDFVGYKHNAISPFGAIQDGSSFMLDNGGNFTFPAIAPRNEEGELSLSDFTEGEFHYGEWFFGILLWKNNISYWATADYSIGSDNFNKYSVNFKEILSAHTGIFRAVPFLANKQFSSNGSLPANLMVIGIERTPVDFIEIETLQNLLKIGLAVYYKTSGTLLCNVTISNGTNASASITNGYIEAATSNSGASATTIKSGISMTVAAGKSVTTSFEVAVSRSDFKYVRFVSSKISSSWIGMMNARPEPMV